MSWRALSYKEAAQFLGVTTSTLAKYRRQGRLRGIRVQGYGDSSRAVYRYHQEELNKIKHDSLD